MPDQISRWRSIDRAWFRAAAFGALRFAADLHRTEGAEWWMHPELRVAILADNHLAVYLVTERGETFLGVPLRVTPHLGNSMLQLRVSCHRHGGHLVTIDVESSPEAWDGPIQFADLTDPNRRNP